MVLSLCNRPSAFTLGSCGPWLVALILRLTTTCIQQHPHPRHALKLRLPQSTPAASFHDVASGGIVSAELLQATCHEPGWRTVGPVPACPSTLHKPSPFDGSLAAHPCPSAELVDHQVHQFRISKQPVSYLTSQGQQRPGLSGGVSQRIDHGNTALAASTKTTETAKRDRAVPTSSALRVTHDGLLCRCAWQLVRAALTSTHGPKKHKRPHPTSHQIQAGISCNAPAHSAETRSRRRQLRPDKKEPGCIRSIHEWTKHQERRRRLPSPDTDGVWRVHSVHYTPSRNAVTSSKHCNCMRQGG